MLLDDIKILIKDFEKSLIKDVRFKKDYQFKQQVKALYKKKHLPVIQSQIIVPMPYYSGPSKTKTEEKKCAGEKNYDEEDINDFEKEDNELIQLNKRLEELLSNPYSDTEMKELDKLDEKQILERIKQKTREIKNIREEINKKKG